MRLAWSDLAVVLLALGACGDGDARPTACEVGPTILGEAISALLASEPSCLSDDECVLFSFDVSCPDGYSNLSCPSFTHRDSAASWSQTAVCKSIDEASAPSDLDCTTEASCANLGTPVCRAGKCVGSN
jgi:hypothetical protein